MKLTANIGFFLATILLMLHSVLPHQHHDELSQEEHLAQNEEARTWLDYLKLAFHTDLGDSHLEEFETQNYSQLVLFFSWDVITPICHEFRLLDKPLFAETTFLALKSPHLISHGFRGPPSR